MIDKSISGSSKKIFTLNFNQNFECFVCGDSDGFRIFNVNPLKQVLKENVVGGVYYAEMLYRCNYVALVGGGGLNCSLQYSNTKVLIYDCSLGKMVVEIDVGEPVLAVRLRRDTIVIVMKSSISIFSFSDIPVELLRARTWPNDNGICAVSTSNKHSFLAFPSTSGIGVLEIVNLANRERRRFRAHNHPLYAMAFNLSGNLLATASDKGTLIRVFDATNGIKLYEFRRGSNSAKVSCINFSTDSRLLCVSSNHSTIHVFELMKNQNNKSLKHFLKGDVSILRIRIGNNKAKGVCQCAFDRDTDSVIALGMDGSYYNFYFDKNSGEYYQQNYCLFVELNNNKAITDSNNNDM